MTQLNVAIADDNEQILEILSDLINKDNELKLVGQANNGEDMYHIITNEQPDVVLLDLVMPKMDGFRVMDAVAKNKDLKKYPEFIIITAIGQEKITEEAFRKGANYYIMKPFDSAVIIQRIHQVMGLGTICGVEHSRLVNQEMKTGAGNHLEMDVTDIIQHQQLPAQSQEKDQKINSCPMLFGPLLRKGPKKISENCLSCKILAIMVFGGAYL